MSNSGSGAFMSQELYVQIPLRWLLKAIEHLEADPHNGEAKMTAAELGGFLPPVPTAFLKSREEAEDDDLAEEHP